MLAFAAAAAVAWVEGKISRAAFWALLAALVKPPGMVVAGALAGCALLAAGPWTGRLRHAAILLAGPSVFALVYTRKVPEYMAGFGSLSAQLDYASAIPDVMAILIAFCVLTLARRPWRSAVEIPRSEEVGPAETRSEGPDAAGARAALASAAMLVSFAAFYLALILLGKAVNVLPRYFLLVLPFALFGVIAMAARRSPRSAAVLLALLTLFFVANRRGHFYPRPADHRFAIAERSMAYRDLMELQDLGLRELVELGTTEPVFYGLYDHYRLSYPAMGLGFEKPANGHCIFFEWPYREGRLETFPPRFHLLFDAPWLGGEVMIGLAWIAQSRDDRRVTTTELHVGRFTSQIVHVEPAP